MKQNNIQIKFCQHLFKCSVLSVLTECTKTSKILKYYFLWQPFKCHLSSLFDLKTSGKGDAHDVILRMYHCIISTVVCTFLPLTSLDWAWIIIFKFWNVLNWVAKTGGADVEGGG